MPNHSYKTLTIGVLAAEGVTALTLNASGSDHAHDHHDHNAHDDFDIEHIFEAYVPSGGAYIHDLHYDPYVEESYSYGHGHDGYNFDDYNILEFDPYVTGIYDDGYEHHGYGGYHDDIYGGLGIGRSGRGHSHGDPGHHQIDLLEDYFAYYEDSSSSDYESDGDLEYHAMKYDRVLNDGRYEFPDYDWSGY